jgi:DNA repair photolyase
VDFKHPVSIITKNSLILRDLDLLKKLNENNLVHVMISITTLNEELRQKLEPRTATASQRMKVLKILSENNIPCGVMTAPIIPGLNSMEIPDLLKSASENGASSAGYTMVRLNGSIRQIFEDWLEKNFPDAKEKVIHQIEDAHGGKTSDSRFGTRMRGEGNIAMAINRLFKISKAKYFPEERVFNFNENVFSVPGSSTQLNLF